MAILRTRINIPQGLMNKGELDEYAALSLLQQMADQINGPILENIPQLTTAISDPPTQAEVIEIGNKVNALLTALVNIGLMDPEA